MMKLSRSECPNWLTENSAEWTRRWIRKVNTPTTKNNWDWYDVEGVATNQKLLPLLLVDTDYHCSYCDKRPIRVEEIDHFKPKVEFPNDAFDWENLFVVCKDCNFLKLDDFSDLILKPDELEYEFDKYFSYNEIDGFLEPKGKKDSIEYKRADNTRKALKLNEKGLPEARKLFSDNKSTFEGYNIEILPYRFIFTQ
jgi:uncharacterized protein (TIGR02646 family)